jgi:hypothetical protein
MTDLSQIQPPDAANAGPESPFVFVLNHDLFFGVTIANTLRALGYNPVIARSTTALASGLATRPDAALVIVDIAAVDDWDALKTTLADFSQVPAIAFGSHTNVEGLRSAKRVGMERVFSNGEFHRTMGAIITRYALPTSAPPTPETPTPPKT